MAEVNDTRQPLNETELQELVNASDGGARTPAGSVAILIALVAAFWSAFQILLASPLSNYVFPGDVVNNSRQIHLGFAVLLAFLSYPAFKTSPRNYIPAVDWAFALAGTFAQFTVSSSTQKSFGPEELPMVSTSGLPSPGFYFFLRPQGVR